MPRKQWLPLTYPPKIPGVLDGSISQTIRIDSHFNIHDLIAFHGWQGKSRRSPWSFRTPWFELNRVIEITAFPWGFVCAPRSFAFHREWKELDCIAARDGVVPATGEELGRVLQSYHNIPESGKPGQILRW